MRRSWISFIIFLMLSSMFSMNCSANTLQELERFEEKSFEEQKIEEFQNVINASSLQERIKKRKDANPELNYHKENEELLNNIMKEISMITRRREC